MSQLYYRHNNYEFDVRQYGAKGDGVNDDTFSIQAAATEAGLNATSNRRQILIIPEGSYSVTTGIVVPLYVDVIFKASNLITQTIDLTQPVLTIGGSGNVNYYGKFIGISVSQRNPHLHKYPPSGDPNFCGVRFINVGNSDIDIKKVDGFYVGVQFLAHMFHCAFNNVMINSILACKVGIDLRSNNTGSWVNENKFYGGNIQSTSTMINYGSAYSIRMSRVNGGYSGQNHNHFFGPCFQMGSLSSALQWSSGISVDSNYRVYSSGMEYLAQNSGITGTSQPLHLSGTISDGTINWKHIGNYRRSPILFSDAGGNTIVTAARFESAIGSFCVASGAFTGGNRFEASVIDRNWGNANRDIEDTRYATSAVVPVHSEMCGGGISPSLGFANDYRHLVESSNWHKRAIRASTTWAIAGIDFINPTTNAFASAQAASLKLCRNGIHVTSTSWMPCIIIDARHLKRFKIFRDTFENLGRLNIAALDIDFNRVNIGTLGSPTLPPPLATNHGNIVANTYISTGSNTDLPVTVAVSDDVSYIVIWHHFCTMAGFRVQYVRDNLDDQMPTGLVGKTVNPNSTLRRSAGTPTEGFFEEEGEIIANINATSGQPPYFIVTAPGVLAPAWAASTAVLKDELRSVSGNIYFATANGTTGSSGLVHTSGTQSDGAVNWTYYSSAATITAATNL